MSEDLAQSNRLTQVNSPEQLNDYIQVANIRVWIILTVIIVVLGSALIWSVIGTLESRITVPVVVYQGEALAYAPAEELEKISGEQPVYVNGIEGFVTRIDDTAASADELEELSLEEISGETLYYPVLLEISGLADGVYEGEILVEAITPISFVIQ